MNGIQSQMMAELRTAIANGTLTRINAERRLNAAIEAEMTKTVEPADLAWVTACQSLLMEITTHGHALSSGHRERNLAGARAKLEKRQRWRGIHTMVFRACAAAAAVLVLVLSVDMLLRQEWLSGQSTLDGQQYGVSGRAVNPGVVSQGTATTRQDIQNLTTTDVQEVVSLLGYTPAMPQWLPEGWVVTQYHAVLERDYTKFGAKYQRDEDILVYTHTKYLDAESTFRSFEQNQAGGAIEINGTVIYYTKNMEWLNCTWNNQLTNYALGGALSFDDMKNIIISIEGE